MKRSKRQRRKGEIYPTECRVPGKAFLSEQRKEIEKNNRMGKTKDLQKQNKTKLEIPREIFMQRWAQ